MKTKYLFKERNERGHEDEPLLAATQTQGVIPKELYENRTVTAQKDFHLLKLVEQGDFVISLRSFQGGIEYAYYRGIISPAYSIFSERSKTKINQNFYKYFFKSQPFVYSLTLFVTGIREGQNIDFTEFKDSCLPIPPNEEQTAIANFLDVRISQINTFIANKQKIIELFKERKAAFINEQLSKENAKWEWKKLKYVCKINSEALSETTDPEYEFLYLDISSVTDDGIVQEPIKQKFQNAPSRARRVVSKGDVIISTVRTYLKAIAYIDKEIQDLIVSTGFAVLKSGIEVNPDFLNYAIRNNATINEITANSTGIAYPAITALQLGNFKIPVPPLTEQQAIVAHIQSETSRLDRAITDCQKEIDLIKEYKTVLIAEAVTGKIKVK